jgi:poly(beta-D-mannuronate) lyase
MELTVAPTRHHLPITPHHGISNARVEVARHMKQLNFRITGWVGAALLCLQAAPAIACAPAPTPVRDLDIPRFYSDPAGTVIDPVQLAKHDAAVTPLKDFVQRIAKMADHAYTATDTLKGRAEARCALGWLAAWAKADAFLGTMAQAQAEYQRKWDLAGLALAYLKLKPHATAADRQVIEPWLIRFADAARAFFDHPNHKRNNHWYWLGVGLAGVGLAAQSERHWQMACGIMADAARDIQPDGTLPLELARGGRAIHYHAFSTMPLVILAELGAARGEDWYGLQDGALHRLVDITRRGLADLAVFEKLAGVPQHKNPGAGAGWWVAYARRFPDRIAAAPVPAMKPDHRWLGGHVRVLIERLERIKAERR